MDVSFCKCESEPETLLRNNLWACSIKCPKVAIAVSLLEWYRVLQLEQQVSLLGFCNAMDCRYMKTPGYKPMVCSCCVLTDFVIL